MKRVKSQVHRLIPRRRAFPVYVRFPPGWRALDSGSHFHAVMFHKPPNDLLSDPDSNRNLRLGHALPVETCNRFNKFCWVLFRRARLSFVDSLWHVHQFTEAMP